MRSEPFIKDRNGIAIWIEPLPHRHELRQVLSLVPVTVVDRSPFHHEILEYSGVLLFCFLEPEGKAEAPFSRHPGVGICLCHRAAVQEKGAPSAVPPWGCLQFAASIQPVELSLACSFPLRQFLEPGQVLSRVLNRTRGSIPDELQNEFHAFQGWIEAHQQERIELRLECVRVDDLVIALPIVDLSPGERMDHHQVECSLVFADLLVIVRTLYWTEVFIKRNVQFRGKDLLRVKRVVVPKCLQDFACFGASTSDQGVEYFEVCGAPGSNNVVEVGRQHFLDFYPPCSRLGFPQPCALDMLANVEGLTRHVAVPRLAQGWNRFLFPFNLMHG